MHHAKTMKRLLFLVLSSIIVVTASSMKTQNAAGGTNRTAAQVVSDMTAGWNLGNSLDSYGQKADFPYTTSNETYWGNPKTTKALIDAVAAAGFNIIRIPVSWFLFPFYKKLCTGVAVFFSSVLAPSRRRSANI